MIGYTLPLESPEAVPSLVGGKAANLSEILRAGFLVPRGFAVTFSAYREFVAVNRLAESIAALTRAARTDDPRALTSACQEVRDLFERGVTPDPVLRSVTTAYRELERAALEASQETGSSPRVPAFAIRSSAAGEDGLTASAAGQHETVLNSSGEEELQRALKRCWASLWTARAVVYRSRLKGDPTAVDLAVVVQEMVLADAAGVLYTADPLGADHDIMVVNAAWGLGDLVADGRVTPDEVVVDRETGRVRRQEVHDKAVMSVCTSGGTREESVPPARRRIPVLDPERVAELARLGRGLEAHFGPPQDVEWAVAGDRLFVLQSRPVTRPRIQEGAEDDGSEHVGDAWPALGERPPHDCDLWTQVNVGEIWPQPVSPLVWSVVPAIVGGGVRYALRGLRSRHLANLQWAGRFYGRIYYNEGALVHVLADELGLPSSLLNGALGTCRRPEEVRDAGFRPFRFLSRSPFLLRKLLNQARAGRKLQALVPQLDDWIAEFMRQDLGEMQDQELRQATAAWMDRFTRALHLQTELSISAMTVFGLLDRLSDRWLGSGELTRDLIAGISDLESVAMGAALQEMARTLHDGGLAEVLLDGSPQEALTRLRETPGTQAFVRMLNSFLVQHGHHCPNAGEWLVPRWADAPEQVVEILAGYLRAGEQLDRTEARFRQRQGHALAQVTESLSPLRRAILTRVIRKAQRLVRLRDNGKQYYMKASFALRRIYMKLGERWANRGWLERSDDIFFLTVLDVERVIANEHDTHGLLGVVAERRRSFTAWFDVEAPDVLGPDAQPVGTPTEPTGLTLQGIPASSGHARGPARVIRDAADASRLQPGDVLVTRATDPGWTALFPILSGLVTELGGQLSHAAIVAREYGLPAVVGVSRVTRRIRDGQEVSVDGSTGRVEMPDVEDESPEEGQLSPAPRSRTSPHDRNEPTRVSPPHS